MRLIDQFSVSGPSGSGLIQLLVGDLARIPKEHAVDVLAVSAFPDDYAPTPGTLIAALEDVGVSVEALAQRKEADLRLTSNCWLSRPLERAKLNADRILCFEPHYRSFGEASDVVGDLFRSLVPFAAAEPWIRTVAVPLLASGDQGEPGVTMLKALVETAVQWMGSGLPLEGFKIVLFEHDRAGRPEVTDFRELVSTFQSLKVSRDSPEAMAVAHDAIDSEASPDFDLFISYSRKDEGAVDALVSELRSIAPDLRVFVDRMQLQTGSAWQQRIFDAVSDARFIVCLYSPEYLEVQTLHGGTARRLAKGT